MLQTTDSLMRASNPDDNEFLSHLSDVSREDVYGLTEAQKQYGNSWKKRGGIGAFMMLARKWDRLEQRVGALPNFGLDPRLPEHQSNDQNVGDRFDILQHLMADDRAEGLIDDIRDLRRYLMLIEAEARSMKVPAAFTKHRDSPRPEHLPPERATHGGEEGGE